MKIDEIDENSEWMFKNIKRENIIVVRIDIYNSLIYWRYISENSVFSSHLTNFEIDFIKVE